MSDSGTRRNIEAAEDPSSSSRPPKPGHALQRHGPDRSRPPALRIFREPPIEREKFERRPPAFDIVPDDWEARPGTPASRSACRGHSGPCVYLRCRYHLWLKLGEDRGGRGAGAVFWPTSTASCALDVAESQAGLPLELVGELLGITKAAVHRIERRALAKARARAKELGL